MAKVKVTVTSSTKQVDNSAMLGARTLIVGMVKVTMTFRTTSLLAMLCI